MSKGAEKCSPCMFSRHVFHFGNLKMDAKEGVQSFNFEVGQTFKSLCWRHTVPKLTPGGHTIGKCSNSVLIVKPSGHSWGHLKPSHDLRWRFSGSGSDFVSGGKIFGMLKNCRRTLRRFIFVLHSCVHFALRKAIVMASCHLRLYFV